LFDRRGLVVDVEELVRHDRGYAAFRLLDQISVQHLDPELPARRKLLEVASAGGNKLLVRLLRCETQLEPFHDPGVAVRIVKEQHRGAFGPTQPALAGDGHGLVGCAFCDPAGVVAHVELGNPGGLDAVEVPLHAHLNVGPIGCPDFRTVQRCAADAVVGLHLVEVETCDQFLRGGVFRRGDAL